MLKPFKGIRPLPELVSEVASPPYDVVSVEEARALCASRPRSFMRVVRPEVDLPEGTPFHADEAYRRGRSRLEEMLAEGTLTRDPSPTFTLYGQTWRGRRQLGLVAAASCGDYAAGAIKRHEFTRPTKEDDRTRHVTTLSAHTGPVFLAWRGGRRLTSLMAEFAQADPTAEWDAGDGVLHTIWQISEPSEVAVLEEAASGLDALYIADGHHRAAAAARVAAARPGDALAGRFLVVAFPEEQLRILPYNRLLHDFRGRSPGQLLDFLQTDFSVEEAAPQEEVPRGQILMFLEGRWFRLTMKDGVRPTDPVGSLDVAVLQSRVLGPFFGIDDPRRDPAISFVGGIRGHGALSDAVSSGRGVCAFAMTATTMSELLAVADAGEVMPPKSTWFEPKLRSGVVIHPLD